MLIPGQNAGFKPPLYMLVEKEAGLRSNLIFLMRQISLLLLF